MRKPGIRWREGILWPTDRNRKRGYEEADEGHLPWKIGRMATRRGAIASTLNVGVLANKANEIETINKGRR